MAGSIVAALADMFAHTLTYEPPASMDGWGDHTYGAAQPISCHLERENKLVRDTLGQERVSNVQAIIAGDFGLVIEGRFTLPAGWLPNQPNAINVLRETDENGEHHEVVMFG